VRKIALAQLLAATTEQAISHTLRLLIAAWIGMGFRRPEITLGKTVHKEQ
jgi:hypothetical protein